VLPDEAGPARAQQRARDGRDEDGVVELPGDRDEVGDEVDRDGEVGDEREEEQFAAARHASIAEQPAKEDEAVGDEAGDRARVAPTSGHQQPGHECGVEGERDREGDQEPLPRAHGADDIRSPAAHHDDRAVGVVGDAVGGGAEENVAEEVPAVTDDDEVVAVTAA